MKELNPNKSDSPSLNSKMQSSAANNPLLKSDADMEKVVS